MIDKNEVAKNLIIKKFRLDQAELERLMVKLGYISNSGEYEYYNYARQICYIPDLEIDKLGTNKITSEDKQFLSEIINKRIEDDVKKQEDLSLIFEYGLISNEAKESSLEPSSEGKAGEAKAFKIIKNTISRSEVKPSQDRSFGPNETDRFIRDVSGNRNIFYFYDIKEKSSEKNDDVMDFHTNILKYCYFDDSSNQERHQERHNIHSVDHALRVSLYIVILKNLYKFFGCHKVDDLAKNDIIFLQLAAFLHDSGRQQDGKDLWDVDSATNVYNYLKAIGLKHDEAKKYAEAMANKDYMKAGGFYSLIVCGEELEWQELDKPQYKNDDIFWLYKDLIHDADCLDIMRCVNDFQVSYLKVYQRFVAKEEKKSPELSERVKLFNKLIEEVRSFIRVTEAFSCRKKIIKSSGGYTLIKGNLFEEKFLYKTKEYPILSAFYSASKIKLDEILQSEEISEEKVCYKDVLDGYGSKNHEMIFSYKEKDSFIFKLPPEALKDLSDKKFEEHANILKYFYYHLPNDKEHLQDRSLKPYFLIDSRNFYYDVTSAMRVAIMTKILCNTYQLFGAEEVDEISEQDLLFLQIGSFLYASSCEQNKLSKEDKAINDFEYGKFDSGFITSQYRLYNNNYNSYEEANAINLYYYLRAVGAEEKQARLFASVLANKNLTDEQQKYKYISIDEEGNVFWQDIKFSESEMSEQDRKKFKLFCNVIHDAIEFDKIRMFAEFRGDFTQLFKKIISEKVCYPVFALNYEYYIEQNNHLVFLEKIIAEYRSFVTDVGGSFRAGAYSKIQKSELQNKVYGEYLKLLEQNVPDENRALRPILTGLYNSSFEKLEDVFKKMNVVNYGDEVIKAKEKYGLLYRGVLNPHLEIEEFKEKHPDAVSFSNAAREFIKTAREKGKQTLSRKKKKLMEQKFEEHKDCLTELNKLQIMENIFSKEGNDNRCGSLIGTAPLFQQGVIIHPNKEGMDGIDFFNISIKDVFSIVGKKGEGKKLEETEKQNSLNRFIYDFLIRSGGELAKNAQANVELSFTIKKNDVAGMFFCNDFIRRISDSKLCHRFSYKVSPFLEFYFTSVKFSNKFSGFLISLYNKSLYEKITGKKGLPIYEYSYEKNYVKKLEYDEEFIINAYKDLVDSFLIKYILFGYKVHSNLEGNIERLIASAVGDLNFSGDQKLEDFGCHLLRLKENGEFDCPYAFLNEELQNKINDTVKSLVSSYKELKYEHNLERLIRAIANGDIKITDELKFEIQARAFNKGEIGSVNVNFKYIHACFLLYDKKNRAAAKHLFIELAGGGHLNACMMLINEYHDNFSEKQIKELYNKARVAKVRYGECESFISQLYSNHDDLKGTIGTIAEAERLLGLGYKEQVLKCYMKYDDNQRQLGRDIEKSVAEFYKINSEEFIDAKLYYAICLFEGRGGIKKNKEEAKLMFREVYQSTGNQKADFYMALCYEDELDENIENNFNKDILPRVKYIYKKLYWGGHGQAKYQLSALNVYYGDDKEAKEAYQYFNSRKEKDQKALFLVAYSIYRGVGVSDNIEKALQYFNNVIEKNTDSELCKKSHYYAACIYKDKMAHSDMQKAFEHLLLSNNMGYNPATLLLESLYYANQIPDLIIKTEDIFNPNKETKLIIDVNKVCFNNYRWAIESGDVVLLDELVYRSKIEKTSIDENEFEKLIAISNENIFYINCLASSYIGFDLNKIDDKTKSKILTKYVKHSNYPFFERTPFISEGFLNSLSKEVKQGFFEAIIELEKIDFLENLYKHFC